MSRNLLICLILTTALTSCFDKDIFPDTPKITFEDIKFIKTSGTDSLQLKFSFEDGNGDLGLEGDQDLFAPYQIFDVIIDDDDSLVTISTDPSRVTLPLYKAPVFIGESNGAIQYVFFSNEKVLFSETDERPTYSCSAYEIIESDTFYISRNEFYYNFHIEFQKKVGEDLYEPIDFRTIFNEPDCLLGNFNGRIPYYDPEGKSGTITYSMLSTLFELALQDEVRAKFYIYDRALNKSNEAFTPDFFLSDITINR